MSATVFIHTEREPLLMEVQASRGLMCLSVGQQERESVFFDRNSAEYVGTRLLKFAAPHLLEPKIVGPEPVAEPFIDAYTLADEARRIALDSARLLAGEVQP